MAVSHTLITPKMVFPSFSKSFSFRLGTESDFLLPKMAIRGYGLDGKGFNDGMGMEKVTWGCLGREGISFEHSIINGIQSDAILTLLLINNVNRLKQGEEVHILPKLEHKSMGAVMKGGGGLKFEREGKGAVWRTLEDGLIKDDLDQVILKQNRRLVEKNLAPHPLQILHPKVERVGSLKKIWLQQGKKWLGKSSSVQGVVKGAAIMGMTWIEEGETSKLIEEGRFVLGVFGVGSHPELRTIPFQEGEDDPIWISHNSDLEWARKMVTRQGEVAHGRDRFGCERASNDDMAECVIIVKWNMADMDTKNDDLALATWQIDMAASGIFKFMKMWKADVG